MVEEEDLRDVAVACDVAVGRVCSGVWAAGCSRRRGLWWCVLRAMERWASRSGLDLLSALCLKEERAGAAAVAREEEAASGEVAVGDAMDEALGLEREAAEMRLVSRASMMRCWSACSRLALSASRGSAR